MRVSDPVLVALLDSGNVLMHPFVIGELALGNLAQRERVISAMNGLYQSPVANHDEVMRFIEARQLFGRGIGYVDAHLIAATLLESEAQLWTRDRRLNAVASQIGVAYQEKAAQPRHN